MDLLTNSTHHNAVVIFGQVRDDVVKNLTSDLRNLQPRNRADRMIHAIENEEVEIAQVARNREVNDLPASIFQHSIVTSPAI